MLKISKHSDKNCGVWELLLEKGQKISKKGTKIKKIKNLNFHCP